MSHSTRLDDPGSLAATTIKRERLQAFLVMVFLPLVCTVAVFAMILILGSLDAGSTFANMTLPLIPKLFPTLFYTLPPQTHFDSLAGMLFNVVFRLSMVGVSWGAIGWLFSRFVYGLNLWVTSILAMFVMAAVCIVVTGMIDMTGLEFIYVRLST